MNSAVPGAEVWQIGNEGGFLAFCIAQQDERSARALPAACTQRVPIMRRP
jgi:hypothetical protein